VLRKRLNPPRDLFPIDPWRLEINRFDRRLASELVGPGETAFALSNGYLGMRGNHEEDRPIREAGTFLNGFYEHRPIVYGENAYGFPKAGQTMLNCPDGKIIKLYVDDEPFDLETAELVSFNRRLEMREGTLRREIVFLTPTGKRIRLASCRLVSFHHRHLAAIRYEVVAEDAEADLVISSETINRQPLPVQTSDPRMAEGFVGRVLRPAGWVAEGLRAILSFTTPSSGLTLGCGMEHAIETGCAFTADLRCEDDFAVAVFKVRAEAGKPVRMLKFLSYHYGERTTPREIRAQTAWTLDRALEDGFDTVLERQRVQVAAFWERADVEVEGAGTPEKQQVIRWNLFQLLQASARAEGHGIGARGLTGQTYEGHYFWDTEIYVLPFLIYTTPSMARSILKFRYDQLDKARARARELGHPGATFPWRTIDGHEASAYYAAGTAQYHINADIVYAMRKYVEVTGDEAFLRQYGAEILVETARFWVDLGGYIDRQERRFCINGVTGPDEYTAVVNNNYFTNAMARENLRYACETVRYLQTRRPEAFERLQAKTGLADKELVEWETAARLMYLPYDATLGIHPQDDSFLDKESWDFANTPEANYPLLLFYHPLNLYRHRVIKQADTLLAMFLLGNQFSLEAKKKNFDYYDPLTTHDSSLSVCTQSIIASEIGYADKAGEYFDFAVAMDLSDVGGNMMNGAHIASIGGSWLSLVYGFGGMRDYGGEMSFRPRLPAGWTGLRFPLTVRGNRIHVDIGRKETTYTLLGGDGLTVTHEGEALHLAPGSSVLTGKNTEASSMPPEV
jgi:alpha,alpha-trehalose phosphorylase